MARFEGRVLTKKGTQTIVVEAASKAVAERIFKRKGRVLSVRKKYGLDLVPGLSPSDRYTLMVRLSSMVGSKVGSAEALRLIAATFSGAIRRCAQDMLAKVESGMDIPAAMEADRKNFPVATVALVKAGTQSGETWRALKDAADFEYKMQVLRRGSTKEMWSAIVTFLIAGVMIIGTNEFFAPLVMGNPIFANAKGVNIGWVQATADVLEVTMVILLAVFAAFFTLGTVGRQIIPNAADKLILRIPYYKDLILARNSYVTLYKLGLLIRSGVRVEEGLSLAEEGSPAGALKTDLGRALKAVRSGRPWATVMRTLHATDRAALVSSTDREDIVRTLDLLSSQYRDLYIQRMTSFAPMMQVVSALFMTLAGGVMFGLTILPMLQLVSSISN